MSQRFDLPTRAPTRLPARQAQRGSILVLALVLLTAMALLGAATLNTSTVNKLLLANQLSEEQNRQVAHNVGEYVLGDLQHFLDPASISIPAALSEGRQVSVSEMQCIRSKPVGGYSLQGEIVPETVYWRFAITVNDPVTGASTRLQKGIKFNFTAGSCA